MIVFLSIYPNENKDLANPAKRKYSGLLSKSILKTPDHDCKLVGNYILICSKLK